MRWRQIGALALNDLRLTARDRSAFVWMLIMPVAMMWFFGGIGGSDGPPRVALGVLNQDQGWLGAALVDELERGQDQLRIERYTEASFADEEDKVRTLVIPAGFTADVLAGRQRKLELRKEPGSSAQFGFAAEVHLTRIVVRALGRLVEMGPPGDDAESRYRALAERERLVSLDVRSAGAGRPVPSGLARSVPGNLTFVVLMMTVIYGAVFLATEKNGGMLLRQTGLPLGRGTLLVGKLAGRMLIAGIQLVLLVAAGRFLFGVSWGDSPAALALVLVCFAFAVAGLATALGAVARNAEQASAVGWIGSMVMAALGGCWWPAEVMPGWMWKASHALPTAWAMEAFHSLISFGRGLEAVWLPCLVLLGFGAVFVGVGARFLVAAESA